MKWILIAIGVGIVAWFLKPRGNRAESALRAVHASIPELDGLPPCSLDIGNGSELREKIMRSVKRGVGEGLTTAMCADRVRKILKKQPLDWPSFDQWRDFVLANPERYQGASIREQFTDEMDEDELKLHSYVSTLTGIIVSERNIRRMKDAGFKNVLWGCRPQDACCSTCAELDRRAMPIDTFMELYPVHPSCNGMPSVDQSC